MNIKLFAFIFEIDNYNETEYRYRKNKQVA